MRKKIFVAVNHRKQLFIIIKHQTFHKNEASGTKSITKIPLIVVSFRRWWNILKSIIIIRIMMILSKRDLQKFNLSIELEDKRIQNGNIIIWEGDWELKKKSRTNRYKKLFSDFGRYDDQALHSILIDINRHVSV